MFNREIFVNKNVVLYENVFPYIATLKVHLLIMRIQSRIMILVFCLSQPNIILKAEFKLEKLRQAITMLI